MTEFIESISTREWAALFWFAVLIVAINATKPVRESFFRVVRAFFQPAIVGPLLLAAGYAVCEVWIVQRLGFWSISNLKSTILWLVTFGFVSMFTIVGIKDHKTGISKITRDVFAVTTLLVFVTELHSFSWYVELLALPIVTFVFLLAEVAKLKPENGQVASLLGCVTGLLGIGYLSFSVWITITHWPQTATRANALEFGVPIALSLGFLPFLYAFRLYVVYQDVFVSMEISGIDKRLLPYARWLAITRLRSDLEWLERWRKALLSDRPNSKRELENSIAKLLALRVREHAPPVVQPKDGWSPYLAISYMTGLGHMTGPYNHSFDDDWFASSPSKSIGDGMLPNNIAYYVEGNEWAATRLKLKLNVNDPADTIGAEDIFVVSCLHLLEHAVSFDAVERLKSQIATLGDFEAEIPFGCVRLSHDKWRGGIKDGYSRKFEVERGVALTTN